MPCQQCEKAPCEVVCPVGATVHSADGLNDMAYNRCVGTRYCSNNCPYKVRRFNFLTFADWATDTPQARPQPGRVGPQPRRDGEVYVLRAAHPRRGDRRRARSTAAIKDGEIVTACQAACPSGAIVFGDLNDATSVVGAVEERADELRPAGRAEHMPRTDATWPRAEPESRPMPKGA